MNDRELLEAAAKAAGIRHIEYNNDYDGALGLQCCDAIGRHTHSWTPLTDDGDALRLAVRLNLDVSPDAYNGDTTVLGNGRPAEKLAVVTEPHNDDPYAATRRAIVRAAAMKTNNEDTPCKS